MCGGARAAADASYVDEDGDSDYDMEAGAQDVLREEQRSAFVGRREDEQEDAMLSAHRRQKERARA